MALAPPQSQAGRAAAAPLAMVNWPASGPVSPTLGTPEATSPSLVRVSVCSVVVVPMTAGPKAADSGARLSDAGASPVPDRALLVEPPGVAEPLG